MQREPPQPIAELLRPEALPAEGALLVACSGGLDSMALADAVACIAPERLRVAIVDHQLHPLSRRHAEEVVAYWRARQIPAWHLKAERALISAGAGPEDGARRARYAALAALMTAEGFPALLTAHHASDQAETLLMRLGDGAGLRGLRGILPHTIQRWRPWLALPREEIECFVRARGLPHWDDPTNESDRFQRNRHRALLADLEHAQSGWIQGAVQSARLLSEADEALSFLLRERLAKSLSSFAELILFQLERGSVPDGLVRLLLRHSLELTYLRWGKGEERRVRGHVERLISLWRGDKRRRLQLPQGLFAEGGRGRVLFSPRLTQSPLEDIKIHEPGRYLWGPWELNLIFSTGEVRSDSKERLGQWDERSGARALENETLLAASLCQWPITVRLPHTGERFHPLGAPGGKRVSRLWSDRGVPLLLRERLPLLSDGRGPLWLPFCRLHEGREITGSPGEALLKLQLRARSD